MPIRRMSKLHKVPTLFALTALALSFLGVSVMLAAPSVVQAVEQLPSGPYHRGLVEYSPFLVFPENRPGNAVYRDNDLLFSQEDTTVLDVLRLPGTSNFMYLVRQSDGILTMGAYVKGGGPKPRVTPVGVAIFHAVLIIDGVVYKKMYRTVEEKILDLLPSSKTADGPTPGGPGVLFYHVESASTGEAGDNSIFGLRLHLALPEEERLRNLDYPILNRLPRVDMDWIDGSRIEIRLADGRTEVLSISQFQ